MKPIISERNLVIVLFVMVLITFSLAQEDSRKMERAFSGSTASAAMLQDKPVIADQPAVPGSRQIQSRNHRGQPQKILIIDDVGAESGIP